MKRASYVVSILRFPIYLFSILALPWLLTAPPASGQVPEVQGRCVENCGGSGQPEANRQTGNNSERRYKNYPNTERGPEGQVRPAPGYRWVSDAPHDFRVILLPGLVRGEDGKLHPAPGFQWVSTAPDDFRVMLLPGLVQGEDGKLRPAPGYQWLSNAPDDFRVVPTPEMRERAEREAHERLERDRLERERRDEQERFEREKADALNSIKGTSTGSLKIKEADTPENNSSGLGLKNIRVGTARDYKKLTRAVANLDGISLVIQPEDIKPPRADGEPILPPVVARDIKSLRLELSGLQGALRRLQQSQEMQQQERQAWTDDVIEVSDDAIYRGWSMASGFLSDGVLGALESKLKGVNNELARAVTLLSGQTGRNKRAQLHSAVGMLEHRKSELQRALELTTIAVKQGESLKEAFETGEWARNRSKDDDGTKILNGFRQVSELALNDPGVQHALKISNFPGQLLTYGGSIVDSSLAIVTEAFAVARIGQFNRNTDINLIYVTNLSYQLEQTIASIKRLEANLESTPAPNGRRRLR